MRLVPPRSAWMQGWPFGWGVADQACSSLASFVLTLTAARALGPSGLGAVFVGFSSYLAILGLQRALITEPLITSSAASPPADRARQTCCALTLTLATGVLGAAGLAGVGLLLGGPFGAGIVAFAPWLVPVLAQDVVRFVLFRDGRPGRATLLDVLWLATSAAWLPAALALDSALGATSGWGIGCTLASLLGLASIRARPGGLPAASRWWSANARVLGRWLVAESITYSAASYGTVLVLGGVVGSAALGGLRAAQSALMPLTLLGPALTLPGLPAMTRRVRTAPQDALRLAVRIGVAAAAISALYLLLFVVAPGALPFLFGRDFGGYSSLVWPLGTGQCVGALVLGAGLLLKATLEGRRLFVARATTAILGLALAAWLGSRFGVQGAAWGTAAAGVVGALLTAALALPVVRPRRLALAARGELGEAR